MSALIEKMKRQGTMPEVCFKDYLVSKGYKLILPTKEQDIYEHWDVMYKDENGDWIRVDVKGIKKKNRTDSKLDDSIHWLELRNVRGKMGWVFGASNYIAFDTKDAWLMVPTEDLRDYIERLDVPEEMVSEPELYRLYQREDRQDVIIMVNTSDLREMATVIEHEPYKLN